MAKLPQIETSFAYACQADRSNVPDCSVVDIYRAAVRALPKGSSYRTLNVISYNGMKVVLILQSTAAELR
jgi:hypothetical protein